ncbi:cation diffusion facilitator family transporter [Spirochaeta africana]|uniref:Cation diffusion facilitator family transporter n=1 Tax=Spirochaeta africana (strain ATCC 700263 / DSM 8902 / Z-7692) TaxID=889378 RepID=H9UGG8_SPIAZ|nr:cation diffusion facilitator family transporter [Spirochaeta africana]AFG36611.1 cation diffusion facilitator family transporter [Spirochaeta africana DSM 8902]
MKLHEKSADTAVAGLVSVVVNTALFGVKLWVGMLSGSLAIIADAWHTLSDSLSSVVVILGALVASKPEDENHPFGHQRAEWIAALIIAALLAMVALNFGVEAVQRLREGTTARYGLAAVAVTTASILIKEGLAQYCLHRARRSGSEALRADAWHHRSDAFSSVVILAGILLGSRFFWIDAVLGLAVALLIMATAISLLRRVSSLVMGESPDSELVQSLSRVANREAGHDVLLHHVHQHVYGNHREVTMHIRLDNEMSIAEAHEMVDRIEMRMRRELDVEPTIHIEPRRRVESRSAVDPHLKGRVNR